MGFVKSFEEIMANTKEAREIYNAEMITVFWETTPEIISNLLPPPLKPATAPVAMAFVGDYPATNFDVTYRESALFISAEYEEEEGYYCLSMPVTNDMAMAGGRERFGFPKKMAEIHFEKMDNRCLGWTERRGVRVMQIDVTLTGSFRDSAVQDRLIKNRQEENGSFQNVFYNFKHFPAPEGSAFDYAPRLVSQITVAKPKKLKLGEGTITFNASDYDPWHEVEVVKMLGATYMEGDIAILNGKVSVETGFMDLLPYAFLKWDMK